MSRTMRIISTLAFSITVGLGWLIVLIGLALVTNNIDLAAQIVKVLFWACFCALPVLTVCAVVVLTPANRV